MFTTLIKYHIRQNDLRSAQHVLQVMVEAGVVPDSRAYILLLSGSIRKKDISAGLETLRAMRTHSGLYPDAKAWKGLLRCAMELEKSVPTEHQQSSSPSAFNGGFQATNSSVFDKSLLQRRPRESPVAMVLHELTIVMDELGRAQYSPILSTEMRDEGRKQYLSGILTSAWLSLPSKEADDQSSKALNAQFKGKNSLLRRLLDHFLQPVISETGPEGAISSSLSSLSSLPRASETKEDVLKRCQQAIHLVQLVESSGIELGPEWKWDVVVSRIRRLTGQDAAEIVKELSRFAGEAAVVGGAAELEDGVERSKAKAKARAKRSKSRPRKEREA
jgi:pentatricopeptide repeat protein